MHKKKWKLLPLAESSERVMELSRKYSLPPVVTTILLKRGLTSFEDYVFPCTDKLHDPFLMKGMHAAVARIVRALEQGESIMVYGDYDVDGITSTSILVRFLRERGGHVCYYIPDRTEEGYGINTEAIDHISAGGSTLIITVDCGITAVKEVAYAKKHGIDVIVTDHHECKESMPQGIAVLNPKQPDCSYPFKNLAGVGVVFKLLQALSLEMKIHAAELMDSCMDIVALGTVADVMPLIGENRIIVKKGLDLMSYTQNRGLRALIRQAAIEPAHIKAATIGFVLAPRINAAGRIGDPKMAVSLLLADNDKIASEFAYHLDEINRERQAIEQRIYEEALAMLAADEKYEKDAVIVLAHEGWHHGIIGIVASKLTEKFHKPAILISLMKGMGKGSGRSVKGFNLFEALSYCEEHLVKFGGHELAAGLTVCEENLPDFSRQINQYAKEIFSDGKCVPELIIDAELPIAYMNLNTADKLSVMMPYGMGNAAPVFLCRGLTVLALRTMSEGKHMRLTLTDGTYVVDAVGFSMGEYLQTLSVHDCIDIVFQIDSNVYRGERRVQVLLKDLRRLAQAGGKHG